MNLNFENRNLLYDRIFKACMNVRKLLNPVYEFCQCEDARCLQISSVMIKILKSYPSTRVIWLKADPSVQHIRKTRDFI